MDLCRVSTETLESSHTSIAVDQNPALGMIFALVVGYNYARHDLAALLNRTRQLLNGTRFAQSCLCKPQLQAVQIDL